MARQKSLALAVALVVAALVVGCAAPTTPGASPGATSSPGDIATPAITPLPLSVAEVKYGALSVLTAPGVHCSAFLQIAGGYYGDSPPGSLPEQSAPAWRAIRARPDIPHPPMPTKWTRFPASATAASCGSVGGVVPGFSGAVCIKLGAEPMVAVIGTTRERGL